MPDSYSRPLGWFLLDVVRGMILAGSVSLGWAIRVANLCSKYNRAISRDIGTLRLPIWTLNERKTSMATQTVGHFLANAHLD